jgi:surfeit locus 1 family protein
MLRGYSFRPRLWGLGLAALACAGFIALGNWQSRRADEKRALALEIERATRAAPIELVPGLRDAGSLVHKRVAARGVFIAERTVFLANRPRHGRPGYEIVTPLRLLQSEWHVLVDRGWLAAAPGALPPGALLEVRTPRSEQRIEGVALEHLPQVLDVGSDKGSVRQNLSIAEFAAETGLRFVPVAIEQHSPAEDGLERDWPRPDIGSDRNEAYALQWYAFAALALVLGIVLSFRRAAPR